MGSGNGRWAAGLALAALLSLAAVVVWVEEPPARLVLALLAVSVVLWGTMAARAEGARLPAGEERRRYRQLRSRTDQLLTYIRQMNLVAVQAEIGRRPQGQAEEELNEIEQAVHLLVPELRRAAGQRG